MADTDLAELAAQLSAIAKQPLDAVPAMRAPLVALSASVDALGKALAAPDDANARARIADELDRARTELAKTIAAAKPALDAHLRGFSFDGVLGVLELVSTWLRAPTPENTRDVERLIDILRAQPGADALWRDKVAEEKREAELDADVQKSLDEIKAGMPTFKL